MKRLVVIAVLAACVGAGVQLSTDGDPADVPQVAEVMPFPRSTTPLPVPEVTIQQGPWQDALPFDAPVEAEGFVPRCTSTSSPPCVLAKRQRPD